MMNTSDGPHGDMESPESVAESVKLMDGRTSTAGATTTRLGKSRGAGKRVGVYGLVTICAGIPLQLGILTFLGYLWSQQQHDMHDAGDPNQRVWRAIVLNTWMAPTITLASVLMRFIVGAQLVVCTSLGAALILETASAPFGDAPKLSLLRAYNSGPLDIVWLMLARLPHFPGLSLSHGLVVMLFLAGLVLQFSSTLLVSDLGQITIRSDPEPRRVAVTDKSGTFIRINGNFVWSKSPTVWPTYAEARNGAGVASLNMTDTGTIVRALLPFEAKERLALRSYSGLAVTQTTRTVCVPAELDEQVSSYDIGGGDQMQVKGAVSASMVPFTEAGFLFGTLDSKGNKTDDGTWERMADSPFSCPFYNVQGGGDGIRGDNLAMAICYISGINGEHRFLLINAVGSYDDWNHYRGSGFRRTSTGNSWATYTPTGGPSAQRNDDLRLSASVCGVTNRYAIQNIAASTPSDTREFVLQWNNSTEAWNTPSILNLLGVVSDPLDHPARGILKLDSYAPTNDTTLVQQSSNGASNPTTTQMHIAFDDSLRSSSASELESANRTIVFCTRCAGSSFQNNHNAHPASVLLMGAALNATGNNPAATLDGLWTTWTQILYSSAIGQFDGAGVDNSIIIWATAVTTPLYWRGFIATAALLVCHIVVAVAIAALFVARTTHSFRGDLWPALAQAAAGDQLRAVLDDAESMPDDEVNELIRARGLDRVLMCTGVDAATGRLGLVRKA